jgi:hypothetical protein
MLALLATLNLSISIGTTGARLFGQGSEATDVLSLRGGYEMDSYEPYLALELTALNTPCLSSPFEDKHCVTSKRGAIGVRRSFGPLGLSLELGGGSLSGSATAGEDDTRNVSDSGIAPGAALDLRIPIGDSADLRIGAGGTLWLLSETVFQYRAEIGLGAKF